MTNTTLSKEDVVKTLSYYQNNSSNNSLSKNLNAIFNKAIELGLKENPINSNKKMRVKATLNKPFKDTAKILNEIKDYNHNLYLYCLMTFGCLLRPHREIRELTWGDFSNDLGFINLSGDRNKSGRNRIVPVPSYIKDILVKGESNHNIFSGNAKPLNEDYFKTLWSRFKTQSNILENEQTLYSFRHSGAIEVFKRTGSITKLQKAMGHSSINVSLTYLRGLEIAELKEEDMPMV
jgi:integrase